MKLIPKKRYDRVPWELIESVVDSKSDTEQAQKESETSTTRAHEKTKGDQSHGMSVHREQFKQENCPL